MAKRLLWCSVFFFFCSRQLIPIQKKYTQKASITTKDWPFLFWYGFRVLCISQIFFPQWICSIWLFESKMMIVLLSAPSSPVQNRRLLSARNARMSSIEMPDDNEKSVSSASTSPCHSPVNTFAKYVTVFLLWFS